MLTISLVFPWGKGLFSYTDSQNGEGEEIHRGSFGFPEYPRGKHETLYLRKNRREPKN